MVTTNRTGGNAVIRITIPIPSQGSFDEKVDVVLQRAIKELNDYWDAVHVNTADCDADLTRITAEINARKASKVTPDLS